jgi:hypothetical protein
VSGRREHQEVDDAEGSSKRELYEQARKLEVEGRSQMSKRELAEALARAG